MKRIFFAVAVVLAAIIASSASAQTVITQAKALAGNVTPGDTAGYPITITQPGAYRLDSNLTVSPNTYGIYVIANNVDIDMNGFTLTGNGVGTWGVISPNAESRIHDGVINRFRYSGMYLRGKRWTIENMKIVRNGQDGIDADGASDLSVRGSSISSNGRNGVLSDINTSLFDSSLSENLGHGVRCSYACYIENNSIFSNDMDGIYLYEGFVTGNSVSYNTGYGVEDAQFPINTSLTNNFFANNNSSNLQIPGQALGLNTYANVCIGKPC